MGLAEARQRALELATDVGRGRDPLLHQQAQAAEITFRQLSDEFLAERSRQPRTATKGLAWSHEMKRLLDRDVLPRLGNHQANGVTKSDVAGVVQNALDRGSFGIADKVLGLIRTIYAWATQTGRLEADPTRGLKKRNLGKPRERVLQEAEIRTFWRVLQQTSGLDAGIRDAFRLQLLLGVRIGEAVGAHRSEIDFEKRQWTIPAERTKSGRTHTLPLPDVASEIFRTAMQRSRDSTWVFRSPRRANSTCSKSASRAMLRLSKTIGIRDLRTHDLRRTCATWLGNLNVPEEIIERVLNHAPHTVTRRHYNHATQLAAMRAALERWSAALEQILAHNFEETGQTQAESRDGGSGLENVGRELTKQA
jgi:integrase